MTLRATTSADIEASEKTGAPPIQPDSAFFRLHLKSILATALLLRLAIVWLVLAHFPKGWLFRSQGELGFLAQSLLAGHGLASPFGGSTGPTAFLAPGYPAIIAGIFFLFGTFTTASAVAVMLLQTLFGVLTVLLIVQITYREFGALAANLAGGFWAIGIPFLWMSAVFWDTSLSILLLTGALALSLRCLRQPGTGIWALMGAYGGLTLLVNPSLSLTLLGLFALTVYQTLYQAVYRNADHTQSISLLGPFLAALLFLLVFAPWPIRNAHVLHSFIPLRSNLGFELWKGNRPGATSLDESALYPVFNHQEFADYAAKGEILYMRDKSALARQYIQAHPGIFIRLSIERFFRYWTGTGTLESSPFLASHETFTTLLALIGLVWLVKARRVQLAVLLALPLLLFPLPYYITHSEFRFRIMIEPVTTILAAYAMSKWIASRTRSSATTTSPVAPSQ
jgi:hypothetical protein